MTNWDAIIIGGGPAGAASAALLAQAGRRILVLEKESAPHHKVCGEFISAEAQHYFKKLGLDLLKFGARPIDHVSIVHNKRIASTSLPFTALSLSRYVLDEQLLHVASNEGAEVRRGINVAALEQTSGGMKLRLSGGENGETVSAPAVFLATGKHDLRGWHRPRAIHNNLVGLKMHFRLDSQKPVYQSDVAIALFDGGYAGLQSIEDNLVNLCLVVSKHRFAQLLNSWERLFNELLTLTPMFAERLDGAEPCWEKPLSIYGIPYGFVYHANSCVTGLYRLGDQMAVIPSFFGNGLSIALHTAFNAAENFLRGNEARYHRQMAGELIPRLYPAALLSRMMVSSPIQPLLHRSCQAFPKIIKVAATKTRLKVIA